MSELIGYVYLSIWCRGTRLDFTPLQLVYDDMAAGRICFMWSIIEGAGSDDEQSKFLLIQVSHILCRQSIFKYAGIDAYKKYIKDFKR